MRVKDGQVKLIALGAFLLLSASSFAEAATTKTHHTVHHAATHSTAHSTTHTTKIHSTRAIKGRKVASRGGIQCVTFARAETGIALKGNAADWWNHAAGVYQRGARPEVGAVLNFRANPRMRLGHVAVVSNVVDARTVEIDQANWSGSTRHGGAVTRSTMVVDVSPNNDWTAVRVGLDHSGDYGSIYPTYGFIYDRADNGIQVAANSGVAAPADTHNAAPSDLRRGSSYDEVAEAPTTVGIDAGSSLSLDAPDRGIQ